MIYSTAAVPVNPEGEPRLTRAQAWRGLELKARDTRLFLAPGLCTRCEVVEESATHFVREATIDGNDLREIVTLEPGSKITFFQAAGPREGAIINEPLEDENGALQFSAGEPKQGFNLPSSLNDGEPMFDRVRSTSWLHAVGIIRAGFTHIQGRSCHEYRLR